MAKMARTRGGGRAGSLLARMQRDARQSLGRDDALPQDLVEAIRSLPGAEAHEIEDQDAAGTPPTKRRRLIDSSSILSVCVAKGRIQFARPCSDHQQMDFVEERHRVSSHVNINLRDDSSGSTIMALSVGNQSRVTISLEGKNIGQNVVDIYRISHLKSRDSRPGAIWCEVGISLAKKKKKIEMQVEFQLFWNETPSPANGFRTKDNRYATEDLINTFYSYPEDTEAVRSPMDFYEAAFVPPTSDAVPSSIEIPGMEATLFPYQKRTLHWLLGREGMAWNGRMVESTPGLILTPISDSSRLVRDQHGKEAYLSDTLHTITSDIRPYRDSERQVRGGILSEEMGLGKTIEILGLILLNNRPESQLLQDDTKSGAKIRSGATLIVTPESLRAQWVSEISLHAPGLRFESYQGCKREKDPEDVIAQRLAKCDIVLTTYTVLSAELHFTEKPPERSRRQERKYERQKSPLTEIEWWRLCLDEAQMIENGISKAATVARNIPRVNAWAVTGTPVKDDVTDLYGLLSFLQYGPLASAPQAWRSLIDNYKSIFQKLFGTISLRHTKALVRDEISLPPQRRFAISIPFTAVEEQHYQSLFKEMTEACDINDQGHPMVDDWKQEFYEEEMRTWLNRLRQTALHPEVGAYSRRVLGQSRSRPMRTMQEVLDAMIENSDNNLKADHRALLINRLTRGQLFENSPRVREALAIWEEVRKETEIMLSEARGELKAAIRDSKGASSETALQQAVDDILSDEELDDAMIEAKGRISECRRKLRSALELHHKAVFFCSNAFFQIRENKEMTDPESESFTKLKKMEDTGYEEAKSIRRELLRQNHRKATSLMSKLSHKAAGQTFTEVAELVVTSDKGIESSRIVDNLEVLYGELNHQANIIDDWREYAVQLLLKSLLDEEDDAETTGEEMGDAVKNQEELMVYVQALRAAIADRHDAMTGQTNELVSYEAKASIRMAKDGEGPIPEKMLEMMQLRSEIKPQNAQTSMRGAIGELRTLITRLQNESTQTERVRVERSLAQKHLEETKKALEEQTKASTALETEIESFTATMNARLEYYRQLQSLSDSVSPYEGSKTEDAVTRMLKTERGLLAKIKAGKDTHRYLMHLKDMGARSNEPRTCVICQTTFDTGVLTVCGHQFCKECMVMWYKAHRNCPMCKKHLSPSQLHDITMKPKELKLHEDENSQANSIAKDQNRNGTTSQKSTIYSTFNADQLEEIRDIELDGPSYTTKVDTLVRHLLWLRQTDPGAKSIVFSQYRDFLKVLSTAFERFRISFASVDTHGGATKFKEDPAIEVFLLHARAHSNGLNLVSANNVFLCEPLVNTAIELQAIARVDRIGQQHETTVWLYITEGTVEESIYNLSVKRRMQHMSKADKKGKSKQGLLEILDENLEAANTLELEQATLTKLMSKDRTAGEVVDKGDLWECLFGHVAKKTAQQESELSVRLTKE